MTAKTYLEAPAWLLALLFAYTAILAALTLLNRSGADRWWFGALNLYLPQVIWLVPGIFLVLICLGVAWRWTCLPLLCGIWVLGPIMGFCWPVHETPKPAAGVPVRVMTWNVKYGTHDKLAVLGLIHDIDRHRPDLVLLQDAAGLLEGPLGDYFKKWHVQSEGQYIVASRFPLPKAEVRSISLPGVEETGLRCRLQIGSATTTVYNVHFESPREGLSAIVSARKNPWYLPKAIWALERNVLARLIQAGGIRDLIRQEPGPVILAGDLNSSDSSLVCGNLRDAGLRDAFAEGGRGYGYTYGHFLLQIRTSWMRIDHIMVNSQVRTERSWTGTWKSSEHRPVIADLVLLTK